MMVAFYAESALHGRWWWNFMLSQHCAGGARGVRRR